MSRCTASLKSSSETATLPERRKDPRELRTMLVIEERRKVMRDPTISLYGHRYRVPPGYINCRIWIKIIRETRSSFPYWIL